jgi:hypothetical protein
MCVWTDEWINSVKGRWIAGSIVPPREEELFWDSLNVQGYNIIQSLSLYLIILCVHYTAISGVLKCIMCLVMSGHK